MIDSDKSVEQVHRELENRQGLQEVKLIHEGREHLVLLPAEGDFSEDDERYLLQRASSLRWIYGAGELRVEGCAQAEHVLNREMNSTGRYRFEERLFRELDERLVEADSFTFEEPEEPSGCGTMFIDIGGSSLKGVAFSNEQLERQLSRPWQPFLMTEMAELENQLRDFLRELRGGRAPTSMIHLGVSSAGICRDGAVLATSLTQGMDFSETAYDPFFLKKICRDEFPAAHFEVLNDASVTALPHQAKAQIPSQRGKTLSLVMGSNLGGGHDPDFSSPGAHELGFIPVLWQGGPVDPWSGYAGIGSEIFSKKGLLWLAERAGYEFKIEDEGHDRVWIDQLHTDLRHGLPRARQVFQLMGKVLADFVCYLQRFYEIDEVLLSGGILTSGVVDEMRAAYEVRYAHLIEELPVSVFPSLRMLIVPRVLPEYNQVWSLALNHFSKND